MNDMMFILLDVFNGSDADKTKALYARLDAFGPIGMVGTNLFRAQKCSTRAKVYRGGNSHGSYRRQAYDRKAWSLEQLCEILTVHAETLGLRWGWKADPAQDVIPWVLYVDLPLRNAAGELEPRQVSFHSLTRGTGPDYDGDWDGIPEQSTTRIIRFLAENVLSVVPA
jgi:hypothetical protein